MKLTVLLLFGFLAAWSAGCVAGYVVRGPRTQPVCSDALAIETLQLAAWRLQVADRDLRAALELLEVVR